MKTPAVDVPPNWRHIGSVIDGIVDNALRNRLLEARRRLVGLIAEDWPADRMFPSSAWVKMLADVQGSIEAVDAVMAEDRS